MTRSAFLMDRRACVVGLAATGLAAGGLGACTADPVPREVFYRLGEPAPVQPLPGGPIKGVVDVTQVRTQGVVGGRAILFRDGPGQVTAYNYHAWAEPAGVMLQRALVVTLRNAQAFETVAMPVMRLDRDYELLGDLHLLEHVLRGNSASALIEIEVSLRRIRGDVSLLMKTYRVEEPAAGTGVAAGVAAFTRAMDKISAELLVDLASVPKEA